MAANEGLFSLKLKDNCNSDKPYSPVKIAGMDRVTKMKLLTKLKFAVAIYGTYFFSSIYIRDVLHPKYKSRIDGTFVEIIGKKCM